MLLVICGSLEHFSPLPFLIWSTSFGAIFLSVFGTKVIFLMKEKLTMSELLNLPKPQFLHL